MVVSAQSAYPAQPFRSQPPSAFGAEKISFSKPFASAQMSCLVWLDFQIFKYNPLNIPDGALENIVTSPKVVVKTLAAYSDVYIYRDRIVGMIGHLSAQRNLAKSASATTTPKGPRGYERQRTVPIGLGDQSSCL
jgi:hypothetical protein